MGMIGRNILMRDDREETDCISIGRRISLQFTLVCSVADINDIFLTLLNLLPQAWAVSRVVSDCVIGLLFNKHICIHKFL